MMYASSKSASTVIFKISELATLEIPVSNHQIKLVSVGIYYLYITDHGSEVKITLITAI